MCFWWICFELLQTAASNAIHCAHCLTAHCTHCRGRQPSIALANRIAGNCIAEHCLSQWHCSLAFPLPPFCQLLWLEKEDFDPIHIKGHSHPDWLPLVQINGSENIRDTIRKKEKCHQTSSAYGGMTSSKISVLLFENSEKTKTSLMWPWPARSSKSKPTKLYWPHVPRSSEASWKRTPTPIHSSTYGMSNTQIF